jgi:mannosyltransferase OCH1-like enzyme
MIEKNIHQIWIGDKRIPKHIKEWMHEIKEKHPKFTYYFWTDDNLPDMPKELYDIYQNIKDPITTSAKSDLLRIYVVHNYGGVYLDADFQHINGLNGSSIDFDNMNGYISVNDNYGIEALGCNFFAFSKDHVLLKVLLDGIKNSDQWLGPNYWSIELFNYFGLSEPVNKSDFISHLDSHNVKLINTNELESKYFRHVALASWYPNSEWNNKFKTGDYE